MDDLHRRALVRGVGTFAAVAVVGSSLVWALGRGGDTSAATPSVEPSPTVSVSVAPPAPLAWLTWVPGGLPPGYGDLVNTVSDVVASTTATADIAWMTASLDAEGNGVDEPQTPMMIPIETTGIEPTFAAFIPEPERQLVQNLQPNQGIVSESEAQLRGLGTGATLLFRGGQKIEIVGTLPDALMGAYELLVPRDTGMRLGVTHERYVLFHVRPASEVTPRDLIQSFRDLLPATALFPAVEVRAPGEAGYLRANDRAIPPVMLKLKFGEFEAHPDNTDPTRLVIDPGWVQDHIQSSTLPLLGTVTCHVKALFLLKQAMKALTAANVLATISDVGTCFDPVASPDDPNGPLTAAAWGASIEINPTENPPGTRPTQPKELVQEMYRWGYGWGGNDAFPQGALFRYRKPPVGPD
jgi:hypothetical protein